MSEVIDSAVKKLTEQQGDTTKNPYLKKAIVEYMTEECKKDEVLSAHVCQKQKTLDKCVFYLMLHAREYMEQHDDGECLGFCIESDIVYHWMKDYYNKDDAAIEAEAAKKAAEAKEQQEKAAAKEKAAQAKRQKEEAAKKAAAAEEKKKSAAEKKAEKKAAKAAEERKEESEAGQLSLF